VRELSWTRPLASRRRGLRAQFFGVRIFVLSFAGVILAGTLGFLLLPGLYTGARLGVIDALFTATSAVCVTGLIVVDTATAFTHLGQFWVLLLIQAGGLGILTFATIIIRLVGRRSSLDVESATGSGIGGTVGSIGLLLRSVLAMTFAIEGVGAIGLWLLWREPLGAGPAAWHAVFHAVSAFCNAGFSTFSDNLAGWRTAPPVLLSVSGLVVLGGLGFVVLNDLWGRFVSRRVRHVATQTRIAVWTTGVLIVGATAVFLYFEGPVTLSELGPVGRLTNALFMAITPRTAGFNTVDYGLASNPTVALTVALMIIGGSPGSTAGGIKTTSAALLVLGLWARLRGHRHVAVGGRTVREETIVSAAGLAIGGIAILALATFLLLLVEPATAVRDRADFVRVVFEVHSAFGTVGLSMNKTGEVTPAGRLILVALMFVGRVGPIALAAAMAARVGRRAAYRYAYDEVAVG